VCSIQLDIDLTYYCSCTGNDYNGMPKVSLTNQGFENGYVFNPIDYMLYPEVYEDTRETMCAMSLYNNFDTQISGITTQDKFILGQVFFRQNTLIISYENEGIMLVGVNKG